MRDSLFYDTFETENRIKQIMVTQDQIDEIVRIFVQKCQPEKIILFGSYAHGTANEDSDLDIAVVKKSELPRRKRSTEFRIALRENGQRWLFPMDVLVYTPEEMEAYKSDKYSLVHEILLTGKTLYDESKKSARLVHQG
ncbi:MAG: nucleotidyltransferase domain-containing protein [Saprospiraceae bacterium]